ncbi:MAG: SIS domain-containing protein [Parachlamydiales bacterium]|nr:SIS domain-containing protein [Parachlamydiales bacterium]
MTHPIRAENQTYNPHTRPIKPPPIFPPFKIPDLRGLKIIECDEQAVLKDLSIGDIEQAYRTLLASPQNQFNCLIPRLKVLVELLGPCFANDIFRLGVNCDELQKSTKLSSLDFNQALNELAQQKYIRIQNERIFITGPLVTDPTAKTYAEFFKEFNLGNATTEQQQLLTMNLSQTLLDDTVSGLKQLLRVDKLVVDGLKDFNKNYLDELAHTMATTIRKGGRIFTGGSGSSGRVGVDLSAKCRAFCDEERSLDAYKNSFHEIMSGGLSAFIRAKEKFEDDAQAGKKFIDDANVNASDMVILISASGSATFNSGAALEARKRGATVYYFYNSENIPSRTQELFTKHNVLPICINIGPQAITGSTRLQAATIALSALGTAFESCLCILDDTFYDIAHNANDIIKNIVRGNNILESKLETIAKIVELEEKTFNSEFSNFRMASDTNHGGYITFVGSKKVMRTVMPDTTEIPPTFDTPKPRRIYETTLRRPFYQAFTLVSGDDIEKTELEAWKKMLVKDSIDDIEWEDLKDFSISQSANTHPDSFSNRPMGDDNLFIAVYDSKDYEEWQAIKNCLKIAKEKGANTVLICVGEQPEMIETDQTVVLKDFEDDVMGITSSVILKQCLNMISNGTMIKEKKVFGNQMIDLSPSSGKLKDRCIRLVQYINHYMFPHNDPIDPEIIYNYVLSIIKSKKDIENKYTPSTVKIACTMIDKRCSFEKAVDILKHCDEEITVMFEGPVS